MKEGFRQLPYAGEQSGQRQDVSLRGEVARREQPNDDLPHEELVAGFQGYIRDYRQRYPWIGSDFPDVRILEERLFSESRLKNPPLRCWLREDAPPDDELIKCGNFYDPLYHAWQVVTYEHNSRLNRATAMHTSAHILARRYKLATERRDPHPEVIELPHPLQVKILDAMADAAGVQHEQGQNIIEIPEKLRNFEKWQRSGEYEAAIKRAGRSDLP